MPSQRRPQSLRKAFGPGNGRLSSKPGKCQEGPNRTHPDSIRENPNRASTIEALVGKPYPCILK